MEHKLTGENCADLCTRATYDRIDNSACIAIISDTIISQFIHSIDTTDVHRVEGGTASRCSGGRDEPPRPLTCSIQSVTSSISGRRWVPPSSVRRDANTPEERQNGIFRRVRGILNKITPEKFRKLSQELLSVGLDSPAILKGVILLIFDKALEEPKYSSMYAQLCRIISEKAPNFEHSLNNNNNSSVPFTNTFCRLLLAKCQDEFENRRKASEAFDAKDAPLTAFEEEQRSVAKHKMLGNIKFICELGKQNLLQESILHLCIKQLLSKKKRDDSLQDKAEDLECLCQIMKTVGRLLDTEKAKALMEQYFERMEHYAYSNELPCRIRFMLQDVLELRRNTWSPRRVQREHGPKTILQIREEAAKDSGIFMPPHQYTFGPLRMNGPNTKHGQRMDDVFSPFGFGPFHHLGTGPGAINDNVFSSRRGMQSFPMAPHHVSQQQSQSNQGPHNNSGNYQFASHQKRETSRQQPNMNASQVSAPTAANSRPEIPPRFLKQQQQHQQQYPHQPVIGAPVPAPAGNNPQVLPHNSLVSLANHHHNNTDISLRPPQNSMVLKPNIPLPKSQGLISTLPVVNPNFGKTIDPLAYNKPKSNKILSPNTNDVANNSKNTNQTNKEFILKNTEDALNEFITENQNIDDVIMKFKELKIPKNYQLDVLITIIRKSLDKSENERDASSKLLTQMRIENVIGANIFMNAFKDIINQINELENDIPRVKSYVAGFISSAVSEELISLKESSEPLDGGQQYPLFLLCLQHLHKSMGQTWLIEKFIESKINLISMLPENDRNKERLADILEDRALGFLYPMLRIESDLWKQIIQEDCTPTTLYRWIKENVDSSLQNTTEFIQVLFICLLKFITAEVPKQSINENDIQLSSQTNGTNIIDHEKEQFAKYQQVFQAFLHEKTNLQLVVLYALQSYCYNVGFPKGLLLRWFMMLYDLEIVEEEVFIKWKEDINDEFPGKGKALFQVNQWLTWLEEAEEEEEDDDDVEQNN